MEERLWFRVGRDWVKKNLVGEACILSWCAQHGIWSYMLTMERNCNFYEYIVYTVYEVQYELKVVLKPFINKQYCI